MPIFGADLVSLPGVHLVVIDLQPAYVGQEMGEEAQAAVRVAKGWVLNFVVGVGVGVGVVGGACIGVGVCVCVGVSVVVVDVARTEVGLCTEFF